MDEQLKLIIFWSLIGLIIGFYIGLLIRSKDINYLLTIINNRSNCEGMIALW